MWNGGIWYIHDESLRCSQRRSSSILNPPPPQPHAQIFHHSIHASAVKKCLGRAGIERRVRRLHVKHTGSILCCLFSTGKTLTLARTMDIPRSVLNFRFFASSNLHHVSECTQMSHLGCMHYTVRTPVGIGRWHPKRTCIRKFGKF